MNKAYREQKPLNFLHFSDLNNEKFQKKACAFLKKIVYYISDVRSWRNWQTRKTKDLVSHRHAGSTPVDRTIYKKAFLQGGAFVVLRGIL